MLLTNASYVSKSSFNTECQRGSPNCMKHICGGIEYWLIYATYWGCCNGSIHDLRQTYCSVNQGVQPCKSPHAESFECQNGHCIPEPWLCNNANDCQDGSDEAGCDECKGTHVFRCWNKRCVPQSVVCDAYNDCGDGSDETFCRTLDGGWCKTQEFRCATDVCVPITHVCDGKADCADSSDEIGCIEGMISTRKFFVSFVQWLYSQKYVSEIREHLRLKGPRYGWTSLIQRFLFESKGVWGKGTIMLAEDAFSLLPSSTARFLVFNHTYCFGITWGPSAEEKRCGQDLQGTGFLSKGKE